MVGGRGTRRELRPEIQAIRAAAVLLVVLFHLWPGRLPGGYIGVDVFFVISGFLITSHLLREVDAHGRVSLPQFWARRARRLLPAAYLVLAVTAVCVIVWLPESQWSQNFREITGSAVYVVNWVLAADAVDYLASDGVPSAVQHYWTLSVEEQFYIAWPLLIVLALALSRGFTRVNRRQAIVVVLAVTTLASFAYSLWITANNPQLAYFATPARAWQFGAGALFALWESRRRTRAGALPGAALVSWLGFLALLACGVIYDETTPFPGTAAVVPVVATIAIIAAGMPAGRLSPAPLLNWRPVQVTGDISYSMYLWHWPPIIILPVALGHDLGFWTRFGILIATFAAAWLTKRYVEDPVRFTHRFGMRRPAITAAVTATAAAVLVAGSMSGYAAAKSAERAASELTDRLNADMPECFGAASMDPLNPCHNPELDGMLVPNGTDVRADFADYPECWADNAIDELRTCEFGDTSDPSVPHVVLVGDSHARALLPAFVRLSEAGDIAFTATLKAGCPWTVAATIETALAERQRTCKAWKPKLQEWLLETADDIDLLITTGYAKILRGDLAQRVDDLVAAWQPVADRGVTIAAISDNPYHDFLPAACLEGEQSWDETTCAVKRADAFPYGDPFGEAAERIRGASKVDLTDWYCSEEWCPSVIGGVNVYRDNSHLTITFTRTLAPYLLRALREHDLV